MPNIRIVVASMITFILFLGVMSFVTDRGYDKIMPIIEEQKQKALEQQKLLSELTQKNLEDLGISPSVYLDNMESRLKEEFPDYQSSIRPLRPIGTWIGVRKGKGNQIAVIKFEKSKYWLMIKDSVNGDIKEKGKYEYYFDQINFKPKDKSDYILDYLMVSHNGFQLFGDQLSYTFEKTDNIKIDF